MLPLGAKTHSVGVCGAGVFVVAEGTNGVCKGNTCQRGKIAARGKGGLSLAARPGARVSLLFAKEDREAISRSVGYWRRCILRALRSGKLLGAMS